LEEEMNKFWPFVTRHWLLFAAFVLVFVAIIFYERFLQTRQSVGVSAPEAVQLMNKSHALVLDLRSEVLYNAGHIINSRHVLLAGLMVELKSLQKFKQKPIIVTASEQDLSRAMKLLKAQGFLQVRSINGGIQAWRSADLPLETISKKARPATKKTAKKTVNKQTS
jgi:rhodanese-related sulfurtransferase